MVSSDRNRTTLGIQRIPSTGAHFGMAIQIDFLIMDPGSVKLRLGSLTKIAHILLVPESRIHAVNFIEFCPQLLESFRSQETSGRRHYSIHQPYGGEHNNSNLSLLPPTTRRVVRCLRSDAVRYFHNCPSNSTFIA